MLKIQLNKYAFEWTDIYWDRASQISKFWLLHFFSLHFWNVMPHQIYSEAMEGMQQKSESLLYMHSCGDVMCWMV